jgi:serine/threonine-protein kinase
MSGGSGGEAIPRLNAALEGRYAIERELGEGGMAKVYLADDLRHDRKVAIKVLKPELAAMVGGDRFVAEIRTTANLQHPHILPLFDSGEADGFLYYVMPYVEGDTLQERIDREKQLPVEEAVVIARKLAGALQAAHERGVIHRDIKPANILIANGEPLVADFGIALAVQEAGGGRLTETGLSVGTPYYMSPEQATGDRDTDARSDLYSLACVLYEMLTGQPPHSGPTAQAVLSRILTGEAQPATGLRRSVPANVDSALLKALERLPADRFSGAGEFRRALEDPEFRWGTALQAQATSDGAARTSRGWRVAALVLAVTTVGLAGALLTGRASADRDAPVLRLTVELPEGQSILTPQIGSSLALSPDGSRLVYAGPSTAAPWSLWLRPADGIEATPLTGTDGGFTPVFSPDGSALAFVGPAGDLRVLDMDRGSVRAVADSAVLVMDWSDEGNIYFFRGASLGDIWSVPFEGGEAVPTPVVSGYRGPTPIWGTGDVLPGGKSMVVTQYPEGNMGPAGASIVAVDFESGDVKHLGQGSDPTYLKQGYLAWGDREGTLMAAPFDAKALDITGPVIPMAEGVLLDVSAMLHYSISDTGTLVYRKGGSAGSSGGIAWVDRDGTVTPASDLEVGFTVGLWDAVALSPDGSRVALTLADGLSSHLWVESLVEDSPATRVTFGGSFNVRPRWTPDGRSLTYVSDQGGRGAPTQLWQQPVDGTGSPRPIKVEDREIEEGLLSPDGEWVVYRVGGTATDRDIYGFRPGVDTVGIPLVATPANERAPDLSPDGRWLTYISDETGRDEIFVRPFPDVENGKWQVSSGGGLSPAWANNGYELFFMAASNQFLAARYDTSGGSFVVVGIEDLFTIEGQVLTGTQHLAYDTSLDDQQFLMLAVGGRSSGLVWVHNWLRDLEARSGGIRR